jgi:hypothetical protein
MEGRIFSEQFGTKIGKIGAAAPELESQKVNLPYFNMKKSHVVDHNFYNSRSAIKEWK